jgi:hypothetical protein
MVCSILTAAAERETYHSLLESLEFNIQTPDHESNFLRGFNNGRCLGFSFHPGTYLGRLLRSETADRRQQSTEQLAGLTIQHLATPG